MLNIKFIIFNQKVINLTTKKSKWIWDGGMIMILESTSTITCMYIYYPNGAPSSIISTKNLQLVIVIHIQQPNYYNQALPLRFDLMLLYM